jgi:hypothetical protein
VLVYAVLGLSRGLLTTVLAAALPVLLAADSAYDADLLSSANPRSAAAMDQGEELAIIILCAVIAAGLLRGVLTPLERRLPRPSSIAPRRRTWVVAGVVVAALAVPLAAVGASRLDDLYDSVTSARPSGDGERERGRLTDPTAVTEFGASSRSKYWSVALDAFREEPLKGTGAGTFPKLWARDRTTAEDADEGHSLYVETLAELGLVGGLLVIAMLGSLLWPFAAGLRGPSRQLNAGVLAAATVWLLHAGLDWDWEMPVLTLWLFAMGGCALAARGRRLAPGPDRRGLLIRLAVAGACLLAALTPGTVALSQARLDSSVDALERGDCEQTERSARSSVSTLSARPEGHALLAYCASRRGDHRTAVARMELAVDRDPDHWEYLYGLALVRGAAGLDPRRAAREARRLNPLEGLTQFAVKRFDTADPRVWRRRARSAPLPLRGPQPRP